MDDKLPAAYAADLNDPLRVVYHSVGYLDKEVARLQREYERLLVEVKARRMRVLEKRGS